MPGSTTDIINEKLGSIEQLPTLPMVLRQVQKIMSNPRSNMNQVAAVVAKDQTLSTKSIRLVNSASYGLRSRVTSITNAIVVLGLNTLHEMLLGLAVVKMFTGTGTKGFSHQQFWRHAFGTALFAGKIAKLERYEDVEECFIAALLHDMGRLAVEQFLNEGFAQALEASREQNIALAVAERRVLGFDHSQAGAWLGKKWGIPEKLTLTMQYHHSPRLLPDEHAGYKQLLSIVTAANVLCHEFEIGNSGEHIWLTEAPRAIKSLTAAHAKSMAAEVEAEVNNTVEEWCR